MQVTMLGKSPSWQDAAGACSRYLIPEARFHPAAGLDLAADGSRFTFGADCRPNGELVAFAHGTDALMIEATLPPIGGIKEKALAAQRNRIKKLIAPALNEQDIDEIPERLRDTIQFLFLESVDEVLTAALASRRAWGYRVS